MALSDDRFAHRAQVLCLAQRAAEVLERSRERVGDEAAIPTLAATPDGEDRLESLTARFARLSDLLVQQVFRIEDAVEGYDEGTPVDRLNRAEKRGWIDSAETWRDIRALRNRISHQYAEEVWLGIVRDAWRYAPLLVECVRRAAAAKSGPGA